MSEHFHSYEPTGIIFKPRGLGSNWLPCFICGPDSVCRLEEVSNPLFMDMSAFVNSKEDGEAVVAMFADLGLTTKLDFRSGEPKWIQVKTAACAQHEPNLRLLMVLVRNYERVELAPVHGFDVKASPMTFYGDKLPHPALLHELPGRITPEILKACIPSEKSSV